MPKVTIPIPTLTGGVSQQAPALRLASQCSASTNAIASAVEGLKKRAPLEHQGKCDGAATGAVKHHIIDRDDTERYQVVVENGFLKVYDLTNLGSSVDVLDNTGVAAEAADFAYLVTTDPEADIQALSVADYTLFANRSITAALSPTPTTTRNPEALVLIRQGNYSTRYRLDVTIAAVTTKAYYETDVADGTPHTGGAKSISAAEQSIKTDRIARGLVEALTQTTVLTNVPNAGRISGSPVAGMTVGETYQATEGAGWGKHSVIHIQSDSATDFTIESGDSVADTNMMVIKDSVQLFSDLPLVAPNGFKVEVVGDPELQTTGYWVEFTTTDGSTFGVGTWTETVAPGVTFQFDTSTLPHALLRQADGKFRWTPLDGHSYIISAVTYTVPLWGTRGTGDTVTNPDASFVGEKIRSMVFWKNRLGLLSKDAISLSEVGEYFSFWRTTVIDLLDSAPIDAPTGHREITELNHAVPYSNQLVLFSKDTQFVLRGDGSLTPTSVRLGPASNYESLKVCAPISVGQSIMVPAARGASTLIQEVFDVSQDRPILKAVELTAAAPTYITGSAVLMTSSPSENVVAILTDTARDTIWLYTYFVNGGERVQSAWQKLTLEGAGSPTIRHIQFINSDLYVAIERGSEVSIEKMQMAPFQEDTGSTYLTLLDRRIDETDCTGIVYTAGTDTTSFTLPYDSSAAAAFIVVTKVGVQVAIDSLVGTLLVLKGDQSSENLWIGESYTMTHELSEAHLQDREGAPVVTGRLKVSMGNLIYQDAANFEVQIKPRFGATGISRFRPGPSQGATIGKITLASGRHRFGILGVASEVTVSLVNDSPFPSRFQAADLEASYMSRGGRRT